MGEEEEDDESLDHPTTEEIRREAIEQVLGISSGGLSGATPRTQLDEFDQARLARLKQLLDLRSKYALWFRPVLGIQLFVADVVFIVYAWAGVHWNIPPAAISAWLGAVVVQVIGIVLVIVKGLFPPGESLDHSPPHKS